MIAKGQYMKEEKIWKTMMDYDGEGKDAEDDTNSGNTSKYEISRKSSPDPEILPPDVLKAGPD